MPTFAYSGRTRAGQNVTGERVADTVLAGYARVADNYDFYSVRYVFAGAERVKPETRRVWFEKFGIRMRSDVEWSGQSNPTSNKPTCLTVCCATNIACCSRS